MTQSEYATNLITGECTCHDYIFRGGSYDLGGAGRFCKHFFAGLAKAVPCPHCGGMLMFVPKEAAIPVFVCTNLECLFSLPNAAIDARLILEAWRKQRQLEKAA